jgi:hypothetical protein
MVANTETERDENAAAKARLRPWEPDPRWGVVSSATPPRFTVSLSGPPEAAVLFAKARADRRLAQQAIESQRAAAISEARTVFNAGDSTKKQLAEAQHAADAERIAREDRLAAAFDDFTSDATIQRARQAAQAANERSWRESIAAWQTQP